MNPLSSIPVIAGPTASGKTAVAVELCKKIGGEIISADSMQVYKHLSIGTAKPTLEELQGVTCHLIDHVNPDDQYHLGRFVAEARDCISSIRRRGAVPVVCGGTGLYIRGLVYGLFEGGEPNLKLRNSLVARSKTEGLAALYKELQAIDPSSANAYGPNDPQRIVRALEVFQSTGRPLSSYHTQNAAQPAIPANIYVLFLPRPELYSRINNRVDWMARQGLVAEVKNYIRSGHSRNNPAVKALGYQQLIEALEGRIALSDALDAMKKKSRHYAKRQETWFRSMQHSIWIHCTGKDAKVTARQIAADWEKSGS